MDTKILVVDPVCGMRISKDTPYKTMYKGKIYYFCSRKCLESFKSNPEYYLTHGPQGMPEEEEHTHYHNNSTSHGEHSK